MSFDTLRGVQHDARCRETETMGFYIRKSVKAGPFRFNMSKSGLGVSAGIPGFRVGTGPRGNYVSIGGQGIYYRTTLAHSTSPVSSPALPPLDYRPSDVVMEDVTGATSMSLAPTGSGDVVDQLNAAASRRGWGWPVAISAFILGVLIMPLGLILWIIAVPLCWWLFLRDKARRTVVLFYEVNDAPAAWFDGLVGSWRWLTESHKLWRVVQSGQVRTTHQYKTNAGASNLVSRIATVADLKGPKHLSTNVTIPSLTAGKSSLYFLPDRVLVRDGKHFSDVGYGHLKAHGSRERFIESPGSIPRDATKVDQTWKYVNVKGGPDRRYSNNPTLPIMLYGLIDFTSQQGLNWHVQVSRAEAGPAMPRALSGAPTVGTN
jgi:hypothetical protein